MDQMIGLIYFFNLTFGFFHLCIYTNMIIMTNIVLTMKNLQTMMKLILSNQQDSGRNVVLNRIRCQKLKSIVTLKVQQRRQHRKNIQHSYIYLFTYFSPNFPRIYFFFKMLISGKIPRFLLYNCCPLFQNLLCV